AAGLPREGLPSPLANHEKSEQARRRLARGRLLAFRSRAKDEAVAGSEEPPPPAWCAPSLESKRRRSSRPEEPTSKRLFLRAPPSSAWTPKHPTLTFLSHNPSSATRTRGRSERGTA